MRVLPERLRLWGPVPPPWLVDRFMQSYVLWRGRCAEVAIAYEGWTRAAVGERGSAFAAYRAALDREARAARVHQDYAKRIGPAASQASR